MCLIQYLEGISMIKIDSDDNEQQYQVEKILKKRIRKDEDGEFRLMYLVHWKGYKEEEATWEPLDNLENASIKVREFEERVWQEAQSKKKDHAEVEVREETKHFYSEHSKEETGKMSKQRANSLKVKKSRKISKRFQKNNRNNYKIHQEILGEIDLQKFDRLAEQFKSDYEVVGAMRTEIVYFIRFPNGSVLPMTSSCLQQKNPLKIVDFYEKHLTKAADS